MTGSSPKLKPLSLTFVEYQSGDFIGFIMAWFTLLPIIYIFCLFTLVLFRRDLLTIFYFMGVFINELINFILKNMFKHERPNTSRNIGTFTKHGMPSDHSQTICYFMTFLILLVIFRLYINNKRYKLIIIKSTLICVALIVAIMVSFSRVYLEYHSVDQVVVGALVGTLFGLIWFYIIHNKLSNYFSFICSWKISEYLMLRDYTNIPNILLFQYKCERNEAK